MKKYFLPLLLLCSCYSNDSHEQKVVAEEWVIDTSNLLNVEVTEDHLSPLMSIRHVFSEVDYIALESVNGFYLSAAKKILDLGDTLLVQDKNKSILVAYDSQGNFLGQIGRKGQGPEEYAGVWDFDVDYESGNIFIYSRADQSVLVYDSEFFFVEKIRVGQYAMHFAVLESNRLAFYMDMAGAGKNILLTDIKGNKVGERMPYPSDKRYVVFGESGLLRPGGYFNYPLSSTIRKLDLDSEVDPGVMSVYFDNVLSETEIFEHQKYIENPREQKFVLGKYSVGSGGKELVFSYEYKKGVSRRIGPGIRLASGQVYDHFNLKLGKDSDAFASLFFRGPYIPDFSPKTGYFTILINQEGLSLLEDEGILEDLGDVDEELYDLVSENWTEGTAFLMKFKLKSHYDPFEER